MTGKRRRALRALRIGCAAILAFWACAAAAAEAVPFARDLAADGRAARESGRVIVVLYGTADCPYCRKVRKGFLEPMQADLAAAKRVLLREIDVESGRPVVGFDGHATTHAALAKSRKARIVPYVVFLGPQGEPLADPLVGISSTDLYGGLLERRIETARAKLTAQ
jgi:thioredoxin-related protein